VSHKDKPADVVGQTLSEDLVGADGRKVIAKGGTVITEKIWTAIKDGKLASVRIRPVVTDQIDYLAADEEEKFYIAQANAPLDDGQHFLEERVMVRYRDKFLIEPADDVDYMDVSPKQIVSVATRSSRSSSTTTQTAP
jgi:DNA-directed RNA polymerase subunit beta